MITNSQNKEKHVEDDFEGWLVVFCKRKKRQPNFIQTKSHFHQKHEKVSSSHKKGEKKQEDVEA